MVRIWGGGRTDVGFFISLTFEESHTAAHPLFIFIEVDPDHFPLAKAGEVDSLDWPGCAIFPEIQHADLCFGGDIRCQDDVGIFNLALKYPVLRMVSIRNSPGLQAVV